MREILFRGKRVDNGEWVYGYLIKGATRYVIQESIAQYPQYDVIPETIGQYTGLTNKYNEKIFEGDILRDYGNDIEDWVISYEDGAFIGTFENVCEHLYEISDLEVIGSIHD